MYRRIGFLGCTLFLSWTVFLLPAKAQEGQPSGWKNLDAAAFIEYADPLLGDEEGRHVLIDHAWQRFLNDESFIAKADWKTVEDMVRLAAWLKRERTAQGRSVAEIDAQTVTLADRLVTRHATSKNLPLGSVKILFRDLFMHLDYPSNIINDKELRLKWSRLRAEYNDWKTLPLNKQVELVSDVLSEDKLDRAQMSARWTGSISAPSEGSYTFYLVKGHPGLPKYQLWIDGDLVLDSTIQTDSTAEFFVSKPVALRNRKPVSLRLEIADLREGTSGHPGWLAAALLWKNKEGSGEPRLVPGSSLAPPADFKAQSTTGLKGEYFKDKSLTELVAERLDSSLEFAWNRGPVLPLQEEEYSEVIEHCVTSLLKNKSLANVPKAERQYFVNDTYVRLLGRLPLSRRATLVKRLTNQRSLLSETKPRTMERVISLVYYLPGAEHVDLLAAWSQARSLPRFQPGNPRRVGIGNVRSVLPGPTGSSFRDNWRPYWLIARRLQGPYWKNLETLQNTHLERSDGQCNLPIAYISAFAANSQTRSSGQPRLKQFVNRLDAKLAEKELTGDQRVSWLIARSFADEAATTRQPRLLIGKEYLEEALLIAESQDYKFWALQELMTRYTALGEQRELKQLLARRKGQFIEADQVEMVMACELMCTEYQKSHRHNQEVATNVKRKTYIRELERRLTQAQERQDDASVTLFQGRLEALQTETPSQ